jgi:hypothetical protein
MLTKLPQKFHIQPVIEQVNALGDFGKRLELNTPTGEFFNDPWQIKEEFLNTPLGNVLSSLGNIGQARLLCLHSAESYTAHCDPDDRIHLAVITNPYAFLVDISDNHLYHVPADGNLWHMDTGKVHVAANWGPRTRVHLNVRVLLPKYTSDRKGLRIKILDGDYDWKQLAYTPIMRTINQGVKSGEITGFKGVGDKEVLINTELSTALTPAITEIQKSNITLEIEEV